MDNKLLKKCSDNWGKMLSVMVVVWLATPVLIWALHSVTHPFLESPALNHNAFGTFGDMFGFTNSLFSGFALVLVIISVSLQATELSQFASTYAKDSFERTFFNMINLFNEQRNSIEHNERLVGSEYMSIMVSHLEKFRHLDAYNQISICNLRNEYPELEEKLKGISRSKTSVLKRFPHCSKGEVNCLFNMCFNNSKKGDDVKRYIRVVKNVLDYSCNEIVPLPDGAKVSDERPVTKEQRKELAKYARIFWGQFLEAEIEFLLIYNYANQESGTGLDSYLKLMQPDPDIVHQIEGKHKFLSKG